MFWGLVLAVFAAFIGCSRILFIAHFPWTDPKIALITVGVIVAWFYRTGTQDRSINRLVLLYALCMVPGTVSAWKSGLLQISLGGVPGTYSGSVWTSALCASGLLLAARLNDEQKANITRLIMCLGAITAVQCAIQHIGIDPMSVGRLPAGQRGVGMIGSPIDASAALVACSMISPNPVYLLGIWGAVSRGSFLGYIVGLVPISWRAVAAALLSCAAIAYALQSKNDSDFWRVGTWKTAINGISVSGSGPSTFLAMFKKNEPVELRKLRKGYVQAFAHNSILEALCSLGILGLLGLAVFLYFPRMAGMWVVSMLNPISFEVVFVACVLAGVTYRPGEGLFKWEASAHSLRSATLEKLIGSVHI